MDNNQNQSLVRQHHHNHNHNHNGVINLPPGFRFHPTDEELVLHYLRRKALSYPIPASIIPEIDLHKYNPWDLPGSLEQEKYFFTPRESKYPNGNRTNRSTGCGYWKATGKDRAVVASRINKVVGAKKVLVFYQGKAPKGSRTDWIMHEYRLAIHGVNVSEREWVLCRVFMKKRATRMDVERAEASGAARFFDLLSSRSGEGEGEGEDASCVTEAADGSCSGEDVSSSYP